MTQPYSVLFAYSAGGGMLNRDVTVNATSQSTYRNSRGVVTTAGTSGVARLHWDGTQPGLLMERASTNGWSYSEDLDNGAWTLNNVTVTADQVVGPSCSTNGDEIFETTANAAHTVQRSLSGAADNTLQPVSYFVRANTRGWCYIETQTKNATVARTWFDLQTGVVGTTDSGHVFEGIEKYNRSFYRVSVVFNSSAGAGTADSRLGLATSDGAVSYTGATSESMYAWGACWDPDGYYVSEYVPRTSSASEPRTEANLDFAGLAIPLDQSWSLYVRCRLDHNWTTGVPYFPDLIGLFDDSTTENLLLYRITSDDDFRLEWRNPAETGAAASLTTSTGETEILARHYSSDHHLDIALDGGSFGASTAPSSQIGPLADSLVKLRLRSDAGWNIYEIKLAKGLLSWSDARNLKTAYGR